MSLLLGYEYGTAELSREPSSTADIHIILYAYYSDQMMYFFTAFPL
jgi:hypothetical protein